MPQDSTISDTQRNKLILNTGDENTRASLINFESIKDQILKSFFDCSFGKMDISGDLSINNGNIVINDNIMIG